MYVIEKVPVKDGLQGETIDRPMHLSKFSKEAWDNLEKETVEGSQKEWNEKALNLKIETLLSAAGTEHVLACCLTEIDCITKVINALMIGITEYWFCLFCNNP